MLLNKYLMCRQHVLPLLCFIVDEIGVTLTFAPWVFKAGCLEEHGCGEYENVDEATWTKSVHCSFGDARETSSLVDKYKVAVGNPSSSFDAQPCV